MSDEQDWWGNDLGGKMGETNDAEVGRLVREILDIGKGRRFPQLALSSGKRFFGATIRGWNICHESLIGVLESAKAKMEDSDE